LLGFGVFVGDGFLWVNTRAHSFLRKILLILRTSLQNSAAYRGKIVRIPRLTMAFCLWVNWALYCSETSVIEGRHCVELC